MLAQHEVQIRPKVRHGPEDQACLEAALRVQQDAASIGGALRIPAGGPATTDLTAPLRVGAGRRRSRRGGLWLVGRSTDTGLGCRVRMGLSMADAVGCG
eukprot:scaffold2458_cov121-Isochrysis_galbana.AAC.8